MPNQAPVISNVYLSVREDGSLVLSEAALLGYASDADLDDMHIAYIHAATGNLINNEDGTWTYSPAENFNGTLELEFGVSDGTDTVEQTINLSVIPENDAPVVPELSLNMLEDGTLLISKQMLLANASDIDGDALTITNISAASGSINYVGNNMWSFAPNENFNGSLDLVFSVSDGTEVVEQNLHVTVNAVNDAPTASTANFSMSEDGTINFSSADLITASGATDVDGNTLSVINVSANQGVLVDNLDGTWSYTPTDNYNGLINLNFTVSDGTSSITNDLLINVTAVNDAPTATDVTMNVNEDGTLIFKGSQLLAGATDIDGDALTVASIYVSPEQGIVQSNGNDIWTFRPNENYHGNVDLDVVISDGTTSITQNLTIQVAAVNDALVVNAPTAISTNENTAVTVTLAQLLAGASDIDGDTLSVTSVTADNGSVVDNGNGTWTYTPTSYYSGASNLHYTVSDGTASVTQNLAVTVNDTITQHIHYALNNQSTATPDYTDSSTNYYVDTPNSFTFTTTLLGSAMNTTGISSNVRVNESYTNADRSSLSVAQGTIRNVHAMSDTNGIVTLDKFINADVDLGGTAASTVTITNASRGDINTGSGGDTISITGKNTTDSYDNIFDVNTGGGADTINLSGGTNTIFNVDSGVGVDVITLTGSYLSSNIFAGNGNDTINGGNSADYLDGGAGNDTINSGSGNDTIIASGGNDTIDGGAGTGDKVIFMGDLNQYQFSYNSSTTKYSFTDLVGGRDGSDNIKNVEFFQFNNGTYTAANIQSMISSGINHAPIVLAPSALSMSEDGTTITITQAALLANATDADGNTLTVTNITVPSAEGSITGSSGGPWTFTPAENFNGTASLTFTVSDGSATANQIVQVNVSPANDAPTAAAINMTVSEDTGLLITAAQLIGASYDIDGDNMTVDALSVPSEQGTVISNGNNTWTFAPAADFTGEATISYTITDGVLTSTNTVTVNVINVNDSPVLANVNLNVLEDHTLIINPEDIFAQVTDLDSTSLSIVSLTASAGTLISNIDGTWSYTPPANFNGISHLQYTVSDGLAEVSNYLNVNVEPINDAPIVGSLSLSMAENTGLIISLDDLLSTVSDLDDGDFDINDLSTSQGTLTYNNNHTWTFVPNENYIGDVDLQYTVSDGYNNVTQHATISVIAAEDLSFNVNNNLDISTPLSYNTDYNYTDSNGAEVSVNYASADTASISLQAEDSSGVSVVDVQSSNAANVNITNFDEVNAHLDNSDSSDLTVLYASRGSVYTGAGADDVDITTSHTADSSSIANANLLNINTGAGNDSIHILGNDDNQVIALNINAGSGNDSILLEGKYAHANIIGGEGDDNVVGGDGNDMFIFGSGQGNDTFDGGSGANWADSVMISSNSEIGITQISSNAWALAVDGQEATLTTNVAGTVVGNHIDFAGSAAGTLTLGDGSSVDFSNVEHVQW